MKDSKAFDNIPMPTQAEKEIAVAAILDTAMPARPTLWKQLRQARQLPVSVLFFGVWDCLFLAAIIAFLCIMPVITAVINHDLPLPLFFLVSPVLYAATHGLTTWKDRMSGTLNGNWSAGFPSAH